MERLQLLSTTLSEYKRFETQAYSGIEAGEEIRTAQRSRYDYRYDFWFFDNKWIGRMVYKKDGTFVEMNVDKATKEETDTFNYWYGVFKHVKILR